MERDGPYKVSNKNNHMFAVPTLGFSVAGGGASRPHDPQRCRALGKQAGGGIDGPSSGDSR
eukprot:4563706-Pyramimonas_sp.AAC.1